MEAKYNATPSSKGFVVIGAGLPRTGTNSLRIALSHLLDGPVNHMYYIIENGLSESLFWIDVLDGKLNNSEIQKEFKNRGFRASVDYPSAHLYKTLMKVFPEGKIILTVRDPESWYKSVMNTISWGHQQSKRFPLNLYNYLDYTERKRQEMIGKVKFGSKSYHEIILEGKNEALKLYENWIAEVKSNVPKDKLLIFDVKQGWKPLCQFLDVPEPNVPFPRTNDTETMKSFFKRRILKAYFVLIGIPLLLSVSLWYTYSLI